MHTIRNTFNSFLFLFILLSSLSFGLWGCGGDDSSDTASVTTPVTASEVESGDLVVSLTDAAGDYSTYTVDVLSLTLTRANGEVVSALPLSTSIDFAQYTEMTEFLTVATVPSGTYVSATMTLDYENADIRVEDETGAILQVASVQDEEGAPVSTLEITVQLEGRSRLTIAPGIPVHLMLDFDLQASNHVDFANPAAPALTVEPFLVADVDFTNVNKSHRIRGLLDNVDIDGGSFSVILRPFYCSLADTHRLFGDRSVITTDETLFNIDNVSYEGNDGLAAMDGLDSLAPVVAIGELKFDPLRFEATEVYAGSSVPGANLDVISGWVTERSGDTLTVKGASLVRRGNRFSFNDQVTLLIGDETVVTRQTGSDTYDKYDISIGQHITAFGNMTMSDTDPQTVMLDASSGYVRMMLTTVRGTVNSVDETDQLAQLDIDLQSIGKFQADLFDFTGTGTETENDVDPENYEIFTGTMDLSDIYEDAPVKLKGFVEPFGAAPADFSAYTLIDDIIKTFLKISWDPATETPFTEISAESLVLNLEGVGRLHQLVRGHVVSDLLDLPEAPTAIPDEGGEGLYTLNHDGTAEVYTDFEGFTDAVEEFIGEGYLARRCNIVGQFDDATSTLKAEVITIGLCIPEE